MGGFEGEKGDEWNTSSWIYSKILCVEWMRVADLARVKYTHKKGIHVLLSFNLVIWTHLD